MGLIRLLLAICVIIAHTDGIFGIEMLGGQVAVQAFYIISGFYMTLILNEKYINENNSYKLYISNRLLRIYPIYWTILILTLFLSLGKFIYSSGNSVGRIYPYFTYFDSMELSSLLFLIVSNIIILFQDMILFLGIDLNSGNLFLTSDFNKTSPPLHYFLLVPQAWTISIEIFFYLIAPFIVRQKKKIIFILLLLSLILRFVLYSKGLKRDPWTYRFFPTELTFFLLGTISYHFYKMLETHNIKKKYLKIVYIAILLFTLTYSFIPFTNKIHIFLITFFLSIPFIFILSKEWKIDRKIGELSYPMYISHFLIIMLVQSLKIQFIGGFGITVTCITILFSIFLNQMVSNKIERIRQNRLKNNI
jgi:peptidoglycan/LPS O-acetylase OafA/YrhL